jgi:hypothetical protein
MGKDVNNYSSGVARVQQIKKVPRPLTLGKASVHGEIKKPHTPTHYTNFTILKHTTALAFYDSRQTGLAISLQF